MKQTAAIATRNWPDSTWTLAENPVWTVPTDTNDQRFDFQTRGPWSIVSKLRGLAVTWGPIDGEPTAGEYPYQNRLIVFGPRDLEGAHESGYAMEGRVSIRGRKYRAFTSSELFQREDGSLVNVAVLHVCGFKG